MSSSRSLLLGLFIILYFFLGSNSYLSPHFNFNLKSPFTDTEAATTPLHHTSTEFSWNHLVPSEQLKYTPCFSRYECARLSVPMDWTEPSSRNGSRVAIAVIRLPAPIPVTDPRHGGGVLINPGGPGGSGVSFLMSIGSALATIVNAPLSTPDGKVFDIISWDPRGVNNTTPLLSCFPDSHSQDVWSVQSETVGFENSAISTVWARGQAMALACSADNDGHAKEDQILNFMNTKMVVEDMVAITEALGQWKEMEAAQLLQQRRQSGGRGIDSKEQELVEARTRWHQGKEELLYWGFSYGSLLGATFAALHPTRVGRMVLDGVVNATDYYNNDWTRNLHDTDQIMEKFFTYCADAHQRCALNPTANMTAAAIQDSVERLLPALQRDPIAVWGTQNVAPDVITYSDVMQLIRGTVYSPLALFPQMAILLADVVYGDGKQFAAYKQQKHLQSCPLRCAGGSDSGARVEDKAEGCLKQQNHEATSAIACTDGPDVSQRTKAWYKKSRQTLLSQSRWLGEAWAGLLVGCASWKGRATSRVLPDDITAVTAHPVLFVGNTMDPVTPLQNAYTMSTRFPNSTVLTQNSEGHCSIASPSLCTARHIRAYYQNGALPPLHTVCEPVMRPFTENLHIVSHEIGRHDLDEELAVGADHDVHELLVMDTLRQMVLGRRIERTGPLEFGIAF